MDEFRNRHGDDRCSLSPRCQAVYDEPYSPEQDDAGLDAPVERARRRIGDTAHPARFLETIRGIGHRLNEYPGERG